MSALLTETLLFNKACSPAGAVKPPAREVVSEDAQVLVLSHSQAAAVLYLESFDDSQLSPPELATEVAVQLLQIGVLGQRSLVCVVPRLDDVRMLGVLQDPVGRVGSFVVTVPRALLKSHRISPTVLDESRQVDPCLQRHLIRRFAELSAKPLTSQSDEVRDQLIGAVVRALGDAAEAPLADPQVGEFVADLRGSAGVQVVLSQHKLSRPRPRRIAGTTCLLSISQRYSRVLERVDSDHRIHARQHAAPSPKTVNRLVDRALHLFLRAANGTGGGFLLQHDVIAKELIRFQQLLMPALQKSYLSENPETCPLAAMEQAQNASIIVISSIPALVEQVFKDATAGYRNDPSAEDVAHFATYSPGLRAIATWRLARVIYQQGARTLARQLTEVAHSRTGIDIHPGATIGHSFVIDHGTGTVIGQTAVIGNNCVLYQGVTLGAHKFPRDNYGRLIERGDDVQRHPTLEDNVTVYANASILGGTTRIGRNSVIGANCRVTRSVPPESVVIVELNSVTTGPNVVPPRPDIVSLEERSRGE